MAASRNKQSSNLAAGVRSFLEARTKPGERLCVGLSGGRDSVVLLHLVRHLGFAPLAALHVDHGISPRAGDWADFCLGLCSRLGVPITVERVKTATAGRGLEAAAREARYAAFRRVAADCLLLAHHRGDQAETVLFNLLRGSGVAGAAGMPAERPLGGLRLLRPLLGATRAEIEEYARANGLPWVDDESNANLGFARNFLRHRVMPVLAERFPASEANLAAAAERFAEADELLAEMAAADWAMAAQGDFLPLAGLRRLSAARAGNLLRHRLRQLGWRAPAAPRLREFVRQLCTCAPDTHPALLLPDGEMRVVKGALHWLAAESRPSGLPSVRIEN